MNKIDTYLPEDQRKPAKELLTHIQALGIRHQIWKYTPHIWLLLGTTLLLAQKQEPHLPEIFIGVLIGSVGTWLGFAFLIFYRTHMVEVKIKEDPVWQRAYRNLARLYPDYMKNYDQVIVFYNYLKKETILSRWFL